MNKMREYERGREDGLSLALKIVREGGAEALEKEVRFRNISGVHTALATKDLDKACQKIKEMTLDTFTIIGVAALHDEFGFGAHRCRKWIKAINEGAEYLAEGLATWEDYINEIRERLHISLEIRWNR